MAKWEYKFYLRVLLVSLMSERSDLVRYFQHEKIKLYPQVVM